MKCVIVVAAVLMPLSALADGFGPPIQIGNQGLVIHGGAAVVSDYAMRGVSLTGGNPAVQGWLQITAPDPNDGPYVGVWASTLRSTDGLPGRAACPSGGEECSWSPAVNDGTNGQVDILGGYRAPILGGMVDVGAVEHLFLNQPQGAAYDFWEAKLGASHPIGGATLSGEAFWTPNFSGAAKDAIYLDSTLAIPVAQRVTVAAGVGHQWFLSGFDCNNYTTWNAGATLAVTKHISVDARYVDTDRHEFGKPYHARAVVTASLSY